MQTIINPLVVSIGPTNETNITPIPMTAHGGGIKKIIGIVAAVAVPFAAPAVASAIGLSAAIGAATTATIGAVAGSAIVGAGLGAITAAVTGQSVARGALFGGISGGIGGYGARANITTPSGTPTVGPGAQNAAGLAGKTSSYFPTMADSPGVFAQTANVPTTAGALTDAQLNAGLSGQTSSYNPAEISAQLSNTATAAAPETFVSTMKSKLSSTGQMLVDRIASPEALANATLKVAGTVISDAMVEPPSTAEAQAGIAAYERELALLKERDEAAFNEKLEASKAYMVQAGYYDPQYFANQAANNAAIAEGRKLREFQRTAGLRSGGMSEGELRRAALAGTQNIQSSFDRGFQQGVGLRNTALSTATGLIPSAPVSGLNATGQLANMRAELENAENRRKDEERSNIQEFFGSFNTARGQTDEEKEEQFKITQAELAARGIAGS